MKQLILPFLLFFGLLANIQAQVCMPDTTGIPDTAFGVFPLPYIELERPDGGIPDTVCVGLDFDYTFTVKVGDTISLGQLTAPVNKVYFSPNDAVEFATITANSSVMDNFEYKCDPPDCVFPAGAFGCVKIFGKVDSPDQVGQHEIKIKGKVELNTILGTFTSDVEFPTNDVAALRGNYYLFVKKAGDPYCISATYGAYVPDIEISNRPNPFSEFTQIYLNSRERGDFELKVFDMLGKVVRKEKLDIHFGENIIDFDGRELSNGLYVYTISNAQGGVSGKMVVNHGR